jgi:SAM-dependent methyltransferase
MWTLLTTCALLQQLYRVSGLLSVNSIHPTRDFDRFGISYLDSRLVQSHNRNCLCLSLAASDEATDPFEECCKADSWTVNPNGDTLIDEILQRINSPAPQSFYALERALNNSLLGETQSLDSLSWAGQFLLKRGYTLCINQSAIRNNNNNNNNIKSREKKEKLIAGVDWRISKDDEISNIDSGWLPIQAATKEFSVIQLANELLKKCQEYSTRQEFISDDTMNQYIDHIEDRLQVTLGTDVKGRTASDAAFSLALAGVTRESVFTSLTRIASQELYRVRNRSLQRRSKDHLHMVEKLAASGVRGQEAQNMYKLAADLLKNAPHKGGMYLDNDPTKFDLLSPRPLLWLWRFAAGQKKAKESTAASEDTVQKDSRVVARDKVSQALSQFNDASRPLVVDIGCGMGVSLIGLTRCHDDSNNLLPTGLSWQDCNFIGCDLSPLAVRFGRGTANRWGLDDRLQFVHAEAEAFLDSLLDEYNGSVALLLIQFPTPYRLNEGDGNKQLPMGPDSGFMVSEMLMQMAAQAVKKGGGRLLLQSNCEDVAVYMKNLAMNRGLACIPEASPIADVNDKHKDLPQRTQLWISMGGERAQGADWHISQVLPDRCATETEVACIIQNTPVHRCLMQ